MIVVADTSVLLNLAFLGHESLLTVLFGEVHVPVAVAREFARLAASSGRFAGLSLPTFCQVTPVSGIPAQIASDPRLYAGESEALAVALSIQADAVLLDELAGRDCAASPGIQTIGTLDCSFAPSKTAIFRWWCHFCASCWSKVASAPLQLWFMRL